MVLLHQRSPLAVEFQRPTLRELPFDFRDDRIGFGEALLAVEQFGQEDETLFLGGRRQVPSEARPLCVFRFPDPFPFGQ